MSGAPDCLGHPARPKRSVARAVLRADCPALRGSSAQFYGSDGMAEAMPFPKAIGGPASSLRQSAVDVQYMSGEIPSCRRGWNPTLTSKGTTLGWGTRRSFVAWTKDQHQGQRRRARAPAPHIHISPSAGRRLHSGRGRLCRTLLRRLESTLRWLRPRENPRVLAEYFLPHSV